MLIEIKLIFLFVFAAPFLWQAQAKSPMAGKQGASLEWKRYLQFSSEKPHETLITSSKFFLSPDGFKNPQAEWDESVRRLQSSETLPSQTGPMPIQCIYPARKKLIEKLSGLKLPSPDCKELQRWQDKFGGQKIWIIYAGAYRNNPASLFGHTFLRFDRSSDGDSSRALRSQSVGFLANTPPEDSKTETVFKGILGFYQGFYNIQPYYMQTALYNNSEARSLWEFELNLTDEEKQWAVLYLWELSERGSMAYWFFDENCSFQLMAFLEAVRPSSQLTKKSGFFVLPLETIRLLEKENLLLHQEPVYQASIRSRLQERWHRMSSDQRQTFRKARTDLATLEKIEDINVLDALTEYQTFYNYSQSAQLTPAEKQVFEKTFVRRAQMGHPSEELSLTRGLQSPLLSHKPSFWQMGVNHDQVSVAGLMGAHDWASSLRGLEDASTMEYAGVRADWNFDSSRLDRAEFLVARATTLNDWSLEEPQWSWSVDGSYEEFRELNTWVKGINTGGGGGLAWVSWDRSFAGAFFAQVRLEPHGFLELYQLGLGPQLLLRYEGSRFVAAFEGSTLFWNRYETQDFKLHLSYKSVEKTDWTPMIIAREKSIFEKSQKLNREDRLELTLRRYF